MIAGDPLGSLSALIYSGAREAEVPEAPDPQLQPVAIAIDLGGTRSRVAAVEADGTVTARCTEPTDAESEPDGVIERLATAVGRIREQMVGRPVLGLGIAAPGPVDPRAGVVLLAPNLPGWRNVPLASRLQAVTGLPAVLGNDANLAALGEARFGAGRGVRNLVYLTVSTGIGSGVIVDGSLLIGEHGAAAEAGHMTIWWNGRPCHCGNRGCLEAYASGSALVERALEAMGAGRASSLSRQEGELDAVAVSQAADQGDALARELVGEAGTALGLGVRNLLHLFDPSLVIIGGGVSHMGRLLWDSMRQVVESDALDLYPKRARIVPAALGDDPGLLGAASLIYQQAAAGELGAGR